MSAHNHQYFVCIHTPHCSSILPHTIPYKSHTELPPTTGITHKMHTQMPPPETLTTLSLHKANPPTCTLHIHASSHTTPLASPYKVAIKLQNSSTHSNNAIATHTPPNHKPQGQQRDWHLPPSKHPKYKTPRIQLHTVNNLTSKNALPPRFTPPSGHVSVSANTKPHKSTQNNLNTAKPP